MRALPTSRAGSACSILFVVSPPPRSKPCWAPVVHFLFRLLDEVILLVDIRSPMYFCRKRLLLSSLSCSSLTASMRLKSLTSESCSNWACLGVAGQLGRCSRSTHCSSGWCLSVCLVWDSPLQFFPRFLAQGLDIFARPPRAHGPHVVWRQVQVNRPNG